MLVKNSIVGILQEDRTNHSLFQTPNVIGERHDILDIAILTNYLKLSNALCCDINLRALCMWYCTYVRAKHVLNVTDVFNSKLLKQINTHSCSFNAREAYG